MKIEAVPKEGRSELRTILIDGEAWKDVHYAVFGRNPTLPSASNLEEWEKAFDVLEYERAKRYVLWRLSSQSYHSSQLEKLLKERLIRPATIQRLIQECQKWGFLNDELWLKSFFNSHRKRYGLRAILSKLYAKGIPKHVLEEISEQWKNPEEEKEAIQHLLKTRYRSKNLVDFKERQKVIASLARKGYQFEMIQQALSDY